MYCSDTESYKNLDNREYFEWSSLYCNTGGPMSRTRREVIHSSILGNTSKRISWPLRFRVGLIFPSETRPFDLIMNILEASGFHSPQALSEAFDLPKNIMACRHLDMESKGFLKASGKDLMAILRQAVLLGLCNSNFYDPNRTVIWTNKSLSRKLELFDVGEFYAEA